MLEIETTPEPDIDFESLSPEQQAEAVKKFATETIKPLTDRVEAVVPSAIEADIATLIKAVDDAAATGDSGVFETPEYEAAEAKTHAFDLDNCGWTQSDVTMADYSFQGIEDTYEAGAVSFDLSNEGKELHELILVKKNDGVTETFDQLLELPEDQGQAEDDHGRVSVRRARWHRLRSSRPRARRVPRGLLHPGRLHPGSRGGGRRAAPSLPVRPTSPRVCAPSSPSSSTPTSRRHAGFSHTETCAVLSLVNGSRFQLLQRSRRAIPASRAIRSSSDGQT